MILQRKESNGVIEALYHSSNVRASKYVVETNQLTITFNRGVEYIYEGVTISDYHKFELADSQGVIFNKYIKSYPFVKGDIIDAVELNERIELAHREEVEGLEANIIQLCDLLSNKYKEDNVFDDNILKDFEIIIRNRNEMLKK